MRAGLSVGEYAEKINLRSKLPPLKPLEESVESPKQPEEIYSPVEQVKGDITLIKPGMKFADALKKHSDKKWDVPQTAKSSSPKGINAYEKKAPDCYICLEEDATLALTCKHSFHVACLMTQIQSNSNINFLLNYNHLNCAVCRTPVLDTSLKQGRVDYAEFKILKEAVKAANNARAEFEAMVYTTAEEQKVFPEHEPGTDEFKKLALEKLSFCRCFKCRKVYYAGLKDCARDMEIEDKDLKCSACTFAEANSTKAGNHKCETHGHEFAVYKCDSCCNVATFDCCSNKYCKRCHNKADQEKNFPCPGLPECPLGMAHPENKPAVHGTGKFVSYVIGCNQCNAGGAELGHFITPW